jgi:hypothetical protein
MVARASAVDVSAPVSALVSLTGVHLSPRYPSRVGVTPHVGVTPPRRRHTPTSASHPPFGVTLCEPRHALGVEAPGLNAPGSKIPPSNAGIDDDVDSARPSAIRQGIRTREGCQAIAVALAARQSAGFNRGDAEDRKEPRRPSAVSASWGHIASAALGAPPLSSPR